MEREYRLKLEQSLDNHILNQEILVHSIARLNTKINKAYKKCQIIKSSYNNNIKLGYSSLAQHDKQDYKKWKKEYDFYMSWKEPLLKVLMQGYHLDLETVKGLIDKADKEKFPKYDNIEFIYFMIKDNDYRLD